MSYYTERNGLRNKMERTYVISVDKYAYLYRCCARYFDNIAWKYPEECPDGNGICGMDICAMSADMTYEIPDLFKRDGIVTTPVTRRNIFGEEPKIDQYDQYSLLDFVEFMFANVKDISSKSWHPYYRHNDIGFASTRMIANQFLEDINDSFQKLGLLYYLTEDGEVERIIEHGFDVSEADNLVSRVTESGLKELLEDAIMRYKSPAPQARQDSVEKIWDALERLKTYYTLMDKKDSAAKIVNDMAGGKAEYIDLFNTEFAALTKIGNNFRIRHHETNTIDITDARHYDYFFNRCLSLIALAIQYLK